MRYSQNINHKYYNERELELVYKTRCVIVSYCKI